MIKLCRIWYLLIVYVPRNTKDHFVTASTRLKFFSEIFYDWFGHDSLSHNGSYFSQALFLVKLDILRWLRMQFHVWNGHIAVFKLAMPYMARRGLRFLIFEKETLFKLSKWLKTPCLNRFSYRWFDLLYAIFGFDDSLWLWHLLHLRIWLLYQFLFWNRFHCNEICCSRSPPEILYWQSDSCCNSDRFQLCSVDVFQSQKNCFRRCRNILTPEVL
jgi:hypothetical protein